ncbi:MAG: endonuclease MutS2, partial [Pseudomonadota bacterium]
MDLNAHSLRALDWPVILDALARAARTTLGAAAAQRTPLATSRDEALRRYAAVDEALGLLCRGDDLPLADVTDVTSHLQRAGRGAVLEPGELQAVGGSLRGLWNLRHWIEARAEELPQLDQLAQPIAVDAELLQLLETAFDETGQLADAAWPYLAEIREGIRATRRRVQAMLEELVRGDSLADSLQDRYITERGGRLVVPVKASRRSSVGIVHDSSRSGETAFVEPSQVVEPQNKLASLMLDERREEHRILGMLTTQVAGHREGLLAALAASAAVDLCWARAALGRRLRGVIPRVGEGAVIALAAARHPVLDLRGAEVVPNDLRVDTDHPGLVLTGPNAGGKTVALKTVGLAALFVRAGIPFPAREGSRIDFFAEVLADVGDLQSVEGDLSTFSGHLLLLGAMLAGAAPGHLLLLDEIAVGTDPAQGAALARATIEHLVDAGARVVVTTHYVELKALANGDPRFRLMGAQYEDGRATWRLLPDHAGQSHALGVARRLGMPADVLVRAEELLGRRATDLGHLLERAEEELSAVRVRAEQLDARAAALEAEKAAIAEREQRLEERR